MVFVYNHSMQDISQLTFEERLEYTSRLFLGRPYCVGALGEGEAGVYDQSPTYREDAFDCLTYVNTVLAHAFNPQQVQQQLLELNYYDAHACYLKRFHFMSVDWNKMNQHSGFIEDITPQFMNEMGEPVYKTVSTLIDRPQWFKQQGVAEQSLQQVTAELGVIAYIPKELLLNTASPYLYKQLPDYAIIEIVRRDWGLRPKIGTELLVSHLGFVFRRDGMIYFRHASSIAKQVVEVILTDYIASLEQAPSIVGINVQKILKPHHV